jgi:hypothetical protein
MFRGLNVILREFYICASLSSIKFLILKLLKLLFHKIIRLKYNKILFGHSLLIQYNLCDIVISCTSGVYLWKLVYGYMDIISWTYWIHLMMDLPLDVVSGMVWHVLSWVDIGLCDSFSCYVDQGV